MKRKEQAMRPALLLVPLDDVQVIMPALEIFQGELRGILRIVGSAAEHIQVDGAAVLRKMRRDQRGLDQLGHAEPVHARIVPEVDHLRFPIAFHLDSVA